MRYNRVPWDLRDRGAYVACTSGSHTEVRFPPWGRLRANRAWTKQTLRRHKQESDNHLMLWRNNDIAVRSWPIHGY